MKKILISAVFALSMVPTFASAADANVSNLSEFKAALADVSTTTISITANFDTAEKILIGRPVTIDGGGHTIAFTSNTPGWQGNYVFQVYHTTGVVIKDIKLTGGDAALFNNASTVSLTGAIDVSGNEFGGIESSSATTLPAVLTVSEATLTNTSEAYRLPTIWEDDITGITVSGFSGTANTTVKTGQVQYYLANESIITASNLSSLQTLLASTTIPTIKIKGMIDLTTQLNINRPVTLLGAGEGAGIVAAVDFGTDNFTKHLVEIDTMTASGSVAFTGLMLDSASKAYGVQAYVTAPADVVFSNVTIKNSKGAGLTVSGSNVTAHNLTTSGNVWGSVNVDPGSAVTTPSVFTLTSGTLAENQQIWSDGAHVNATSTVTINAPGYSRYVLGGTAVSLWVNTLKNVAVITKNDISTIYPTITSALKAAQEGDTIKVAPGNYNLVKDDTTMVEGQTGWYLAITKNNITLAGVKANGQEITSSSDVSANLYSTQETANGDWSTQNLVTVFGDNVTIRGLGIMNKISPNKGVEVLGNNFKAEHNIFAAVPISLFASADNYDGDDITKYGSGVYFNNNGATTTRTGKVTNNLFKNSGITFDSFENNWTVTIGNNTFDGNKIWKSEGVDTYYSSIGATTWANQPDFTGSVIDIHNNMFINMVSDKPIVKIRSDMVGTYDAVENWWGTASSTKISALISSSASGTVNFAPWYADAAMSSLTSPLTTSTTSMTETFSVPTIQEITTTAGVVKIEIPTGITITGPAAWDGTFNLPIATTTSAIPFESNGLWLTASSEVALGSNDISLTFDQPIKLTFAGQAGKHAGWSRGTTFQEITSTCTSATVPTLGAGEDCKANVGADLVIWTRHATTFVTYTQVTIPYIGGGSSSSNGGGSASVSVGNGQIAVQTVTTSTTGQVLGTSIDATAPGMVLGATAFNFIRNLRIGANGDDVTELQKMLIGGGYLKITTPTKYFGGLTKAAVMKWQAKNKISATGYFGPLSRAFITK